MDKDKSIIYLEFTVSENIEGDTQYVFHPIGIHSQNKFSEYTTIITVNELGEDLEGNFPIARTECTCNAFKNFKKDCKHIKDSKRILLERGIKIKNIPMNRYWCTICRKEVQAPVKSKVLCFNCSHLMNEAKNEPRAKDQEKE